MSGVAVCCGIALVAGDAEETANSSASRQQNMNFDLKSVLDAEDMSVSSAS